MHGKQNRKRLANYFILMVMSSIPLKGIGEEFPNGQLCSQAADCLSKTCIVGPEGKHYCTAENKPCSKPEDSGISFGDDYLYKGIEYYCKREGLVEVPPGGQIENGRPCSQPTDCSSGYCYSFFRDKNYCIGTDKNCAQPGSSGVMFGASYIHDGRIYSCKFDEGLILGKLINGQPCPYATDCASGYCYLGPEEGRYCIAADMHCAKPWHNGVFFGQKYSYRGRLYYCKKDVGLLAGRLSKDGQLCSNSGECGSNSCRLGPENKKYCVEKNMHCPNPSRPGILIGDSYLYEGIKYYCSKKGLIKF